MKSFYVTGGTMRQDAPSYVERKADDDLYNGLNQGEFCYVLTARQMGKSSLMVRAAARLGREGVSVVVLDLTASGRNITPEQWYHGLLRRVGHQLGLEADLERFWLAQQPLGALERWIAALRQVVLPKLKDVQHFQTGVLAARLVIFVDEIDVVRSLPFTTDEFFAAIRECYNGRTTDPEWTRVTFCLLGVATPSDLIRDTRITPFNIGRRIELNDFTSAEAAPLARGLIRAGLKPRETQGRTAGGEQRMSARLLERVLYWTHGHPYLTQRVCQELAQAETPGTPATVDRVCEELFFSHRARERDDNLLFVREILLRTGGDLASLLDLYLKVQRGKRVIDDETSSLVSVLRLSGIVKTVNGRLRERNRIYERVFDARWARRNMPDAESRRQRAAFQLGVRRAMLVFAVILAAIAPLALIGLKQFRTAKSQAQRSRELIETRVGLNVANGAQLMNQGDLLGSLVCFAEALRLDQGNPDKEETHRVRIGSVLRQSPRIVQMWFHPLRTMSAEFDNTGSQVLAVGEDGRFHLWNVRTGRPASVSFGMGCALEKAFFSRDGSRIVTCTETNPIARIWETATGRQVLALTNDSVLYHAAISPSGDRIVTAGHNSAVLWNAETGEKIGELKAHTNVVICANFDFEGRRIVTTSRDYTAIICSTESGKILTRLVGHHSWVYYGSFSRDGKYVATASFDRTARVWDSKNGNELFRVQHGNAVRTVEFSPDGKFLVTAGFDFSARVWNVQTGKQAMPPLRDNEMRMCARFSPDGQHIVTAGWNGIVRVWDLSAVSSNSRVVQSRFSPDGQRFVVASNNLVELKQAITDRAIGSVSAGIHPVAETLLNHDGSLLVTICQYSNLLDQAEREARAWDAKSGQAISKPFVYAGALSNATLALPGNRLAVYGTNEVLIWDCAAGSRLTSILVTNGLIGEVRFDPSGNRVVITSGNAAQIWTVVSGKPISPILDHPQTVSHAEFSPNGALLVTTCANPDLDPGLAQLWDAATGKRFGLPLWHRDGVLHASFSPDSLRVVTASEDFTAMIWEARTGRQLTPPLKHENEILCAAFSLDGRWIVTGGRDGAARIWDSATGAPLTPPLMHPNSQRQWVVDAQFVSNNRQILTRTRVSKRDGRDSGETRLWVLHRDHHDLRTLVLIAQLLSGQQGYYSEASSSAVPRARENEARRPNSEALGGLRPMTEEVVLDVWKNVRAACRDEFSARSPIGQ